MSLDTKSNTTLVKGIIVSVGLIFIGGGAGPYLIDYLSNDKIDAQNNISVEPFSSEKEEQANKLVIPREALASEVTEQKEADKSSQTNEQIENLKPLPSLEDSDQYLLENVFASEYRALFANTELINNFVVFTDNFSRGILVTKFSPILKPAELFSTDTQNGVLTIAPESFQRYDKYAQMISEIDSTEFVKVYKWLTPMLDHAYQNIGFAKGTFTTTLQKAITQVLDTPIIRYKQGLVSTTVTYKYTDPNLESLPDAQKLMLRMGPDNLQKIQTKLTEIKNQL